NGTPGIHRSRLPFRLEQNALVGFKKCRDVEWLELRKETAPDDRRQDGGKKELRETGKCLDVMSWLALFPAGDSPKRSEPFRDHLVIIEFRKPRKARPLRDDQADDFFPRRVQHFRLKESKEAADRGGWRHCVIGCERG